MVATGRVLVVAPTVEPVTIEEAKNHLRVDTPDDDALILRSLVAARRWAETYTRRVFITQTWDIFFARWPLIANIPLPPLQSIVSITYRVAGGETLTVPPATYLTDLISVSGRVLLAPGQSWPGGELWPLNPVTIRIAAGYGLVAAVPEDIKAAILLLAGYLYENREQAAQPTLKTLPFAAENLLTPYVSGWF